MSRSKDNKEKDVKKDKEVKKEKDVKKATKEHKSEKKSKLPKTASTSTSLDPTISSLFANSFGPSKPIFTKLPETAQDDHEDDKELDNDEELSELDDDEMIDDDDDEDEDMEAASADDSSVDGGAALPNAEEAAEAALESTNRKRKRKDKQPELEDVYMQRLAREEEKQMAKNKEERSNKRQKTEKAEKKTSDDDDDDDDSENEEDEDSDAEEADSDADDMSPPPMHESLLPDTESDFAKSQRTVFLGNVSTEAINSKTAKKTLMRHLASFFDQLPAPEKGQPAHKVESLRFRSTAYSTAIPKKAAFAKKELMEATTKSTNAYVIYSTSALARECARRLNGTVVLDRHMRVDEVAHPAKTEPRRCVFVGNLGFVDDETNIDKANAEEGKGTRKGNKTPSDVEEGLWRTFSTCGKVESVRVPRDAKTRVGKGFAYVQFTDENAVEAALLLNEKKFPPMLPRKLRVSRAKTIKRNAKPTANSTNPAQAGPKGKGIYNPKINPQVQSQLGRVGKLLGRAGAAHARKIGPTAATHGGIKAPENFIFEGYRASEKGGKSGLKLGGSGGKSKGKPRTRSSNRAAAWKAGGGAKK